MGHQPPAARSGASFSADEDAYVPCGRITLSNGAISSPLYSRDAARKCVAEMLINAEICEKDCTNLEDQISRSSLPEEAPMLCEIARLIVEEGYTTRVVISDVLAKMIEILGGGDGESETEEEFDRLPTNEDTVH